MRTMAHLSEVVRDEGHHVDAVGAAGGGAEGGAEAPVKAGNADQGQGVPAGQPQAIQPPPMPSRNSPCLNDIQNDTIKPFVAEIGTELGLIKKHISSASYHVKKMDELIPKINQSLAQQHHPSGPVVTSYVNQVMSAIDAIEAIAQKVEESCDTININLDFIQNTEDLDGIDPR